MTPFPRNDAFLPPLDGFDQRFQGVERTQHQRFEPLDPRTPTLRRRVNRGEHDAVPAEFRRWVWAGGRKLKGVIRRRVAEAGLYGGSRS